MTLAATAAGAAKTEALDARARELAAHDLSFEHAPAARTGPPPNELARALEHARRHLAATPLGDAPLPRVADWFLDNYYLIRRVARQVRDDLPRGFARHLPWIADGGEFRIERLAGALIAATRLELDAAALRQFVAAYQEVTPLTIAELWALPTMLRTTVLRYLVRFLDELHVPLGPSGPVGHAQGRARNNAAVELDPGVGVEYAIRALRLLDVIDWKTFFAKASRVEAILASDPADVYTRMDFATCDAYRRAVEMLAWRTGRAEHAVAELAVALARAGVGTDDDRARHVGHYLVGDGRALLEQRLGYRPVGLARWRRAVTDRPTLAYLLPLAALTAVPLVTLGEWLARHAPLGVSIATIAIAAIPISVVAVAICQAFFARLLSPRTLPKLDFATGLTPEVRTLVVIPTLLGRRADVDEMSRQLELHYLSNPDPQLQFALLTDDVDSREAPTDATLLELAARAIDALNVKHGAAGSGPFHLLHREARWNPGEQRFMGWERKRGKLEELNRLLRGDQATSYARHVGARAGLTGIRFVITLDSDTQLPIGTAQRLIGTLAHPLNRARTDPRTGRVTSGYTIVQPRVETSPTSARRTWFARIFAGDTGFDIYTHAVSELYQDLFGSGIYVGKGIYDVDTFMTSIEGRIPENALVSHDLFEGVHGRTALASDIVLFEGYPSSYVTYSKRLHRWVRGDWQLLPWLFPRVPAFGDKLVPNRLAGIDRWKIFDNLRRSLTGPAVLLLLVLGWTWLPGSPLVWTLGALLVMLAPQLPAIVRARRLHPPQLARCALAVAFVAHESAIVVDAIVRVVFRAVFTRRYLLQWTTAADAELGAARAPRALAWRTTAGSPALAVAIAALVAAVRPESLIVAAPLLAIWLVAPEIAAWISRPAPSAFEPLRADEERYLRLLAHRTWRFFDTFVGPVDQWLPIDNYQAAPHEQTAHRTSPTNIGLLLLATLSAYDFGYLGAGELSLRLRGALDSVARLAHYRGHLLNWYDTRSLQPLLPRYVSTVDSGNFAGCLIALAHGCRELASSPVVRAAPWQGLLDSIDVLADVLGSIPEARRLLPWIERMRTAAVAGRAEPAAAYPTLRTLCDATVVELDREVLSFVETGALRYDGELLSALREAIGQLHRQLRQMRRELDAQLPWLALGDEPAARAVALPADLRLSEIPAAADRLDAELAAWRDDQRARGLLTAELEASAGRIADALAHGKARAAGLVGELAALVARADDEVRGMDFRLLYDAERKLFRIGYNVTADQLDANHYDLLASEARLASYLAIVRREVPESHWYALGRPMTSVEGAPALLSWGGTMFEYLMPNLLMRSHEGTLLANTCELVVAAQIAWGKQHGEPWGISESAFATRDASQTYQYRSFGVPGLGFKRGLEDDHVVTPYASALAVAIRPRAVVANLRALEAMGMAGMYGLYEALDLTPERASEGQRSAVVHSFMAHHQGMLFVALGNLLNRRSMVDRFHADPVVATGELLLDERAPDRVPVEWPVGQTLDAVDPVELALPDPPGPWTSADPARPQAFVLSNGRLTSLVTDAGGGGLTWHDLAVTRFQPDATSGSDGVWIYLRDEASRQVWLATSRHGRTSFAMHKVELHHRAQGISVHVDVAVAAADDVEVRQVTLYNETDRPRRLTVTSAGRPVLIARAEAPVHPAFSSMFVVSEELADLEGVLFARRLKSDEEAPAVLVHRLVREGTQVSYAGHETDRAAFYGRGASLVAPAALAASGTLRGSTGAMLDPIMSLMASVELPPNGTVALAFVTAVGRSRTAATALARRYGSMHAVRWAFHDAEHASPRRLQRTDVEASLVPSIQRLFSGLLFADPTLRGPRAGIRPAKHRLWGRGISGDDPIIVVRVHDPNAKLLRETLAAQRYLRGSGQRVDLVLIDEQATGYASEGSGTLRRVLAQHDDSGWLGRRGGIYLLAADQMPEDERRHLEACARVLLDTRDVSLAVRLGHVAEPAARLPRFEPTLSASAPAPERPRPALVFDNGIAGFTADGREYAIALPPGGTTPAPWCNVLANDQLGCLVSESALGTTWSLNSGENKLTPWRNDPVFDTPAEVLYVRDEETAEVWSPTPLPAGRDAPVTVRHGAGYTIFSRTSHGLDQEMTVFVPPDAAVKIVRLRITNQLPRHRRLTATYYAEWVLGPRRADQVPHIQLDHDRATASVLASCDWDSEFAGRVAFVAASEKLHGFTTDRLEFLGRGGEHARPAALTRWGLLGSVDPCNDPCAALQIHLELAPGAMREIHFLVGQGGDRDAALALISRFREPAAAQAAWTALGAHWDRVLGAVQVATPEPAMDLLLNRWLLYQAVSARLVGRIGFYQASGAYGFRDQLQDVLALVHAAPERTRAHILEAAAHQFEQGDVLHWWHPPSGRGVRTRCSDDLLWLPYVTAEYVAATGDAAILSERVAFLTGEPLGPDEHDRYARFEPAQATSTLFEHCRRAVEHGLTQGAHGLPLMGDGDWNDGMNRVGSEGHGESVWLAWFACATMHRFADLCARTGDPAAPAWHARADALRARIADTAWDGAWYLRAFHDDGSVLGSAHNRECRIDSIAQSWSALSRAPETLRATAPDARVAAAVAAADEQLVREADRLVLLSWPPFDSTVHDPGYIRAYPPGIRENGGQYTHAATWLGWAHAALGDGERAARIFRLLNPILRSDTRAAVQRYRVEPYVVAADIYSCAPWVGRGGWTWYTGSAAWMWRLGIEAILGLRRVDGDLLVAPCIPPGWQGFEAWVQHGAQRVHIVVDNPDGVSTGVAAITLDGSALDAARVPPGSTPGARELRIRMGQSAALLTHTEPSRVNEQRRGATTGSSR